MVRNAQVEKWKTSVCQLGGGNASANPSAKILWSRFTGFLVSPYSLCYLQSKWPKHLFVKMSSLLLIEGHHLLKQLLIGIRIRHWLDRMMIRYNEKWNIYYWKHPNPLVWRVKVQQKSKQFEYLDFFPILLLKPDFLEFKKKKFLPWWRRS